MAKRTKAKATKSDILRTIDFNDLSDVSFYITPIQVPLVRHIVLKYNQ